jgi:pimeloyl-ACP methyl ester carboxylesterase
MANAICHAVFGFLQRPTTNTVPVPISRGKEITMDWAHGAKGYFNPAAFPEYMIDAGQRTILFWDVLRQRGNQYLEHMAKTAPNVLHFASEPVIDGRTLNERVNYGLVRIIPPEGTVVDNSKRPFVIVDPRGGHGPGIGGFKADSEIGVALCEGHPCYFIGFLPMPEPGQTIDGVIRAMAVFLKKVADLHPEAEGKPVVIGNCQAGWALMIMAASHPGVCGPIILAGSPVSYWAGVRGANPMRYTGGLLGGSWLTALTSDLGNGKFDSAWLVQNFENLNPANTLWSKQYNLYANIDKETARYLAFERWWGGHVLFAGEEMQYIVDNLFVGNKLSSARMVNSEGYNIDLREIRTPIVVFCSKGDNITPPPQALGWILDLYGSVDEIISSGQTIVYAVHEKIGHLGIFVSGSVVKKEHSEFASNIDLMDCLPPGLYEAVISGKTPESAGNQLVVGEYISRFEERTLDDIRALGYNSVEDERCFAAVDRVSEILHGLYRSTLQPVVRNLVTEQTADWLRRSHPLRVEFEMFSDQNPAMKPISSVAHWVKDNRRPVSPDNPFLAWQEMFSDWLSQSLDSYREWRDKAVESMFFGIYNQPLLQALCGLKATDEQPRRHPGQNTDRIALTEQRLNDLRSRMTEGGPREASMRALAFVNMPQKAFDEREFEMLLKVRDEYGSTHKLSEFKHDLREQYMMVLVDPRRAVEAIPSMLKGYECQGPRLFEAIQQIVAADGDVNEESKQRLAEIEVYFCCEPGTGESQDTKLIDSVVS